MVSVMPLGSQSTSQNRGNPLNYRQIMDKSSNASGGGKGVIEMAESKCKSVFMAKAIIWNGRTQLSGKF